MKFLTSIITTILLAGCATEPFIVPDNTSDNVIMMSFKDQIAAAGGVAPSYGWLFWYGPVALMGLMWGYRNLIRKPINCLEQEPDSALIKTETKEVSVETEQPK
jgi:hypothetical protein